VVNGGGGVGEEVETDGAAASKSYALQIWEPRNSVALI
jgi:hypothetical protein